MSNITKLFILTGTAISLSYSLPVNNSVSVDKAPEHVRALSVPVGNVQVIDTEVEMVWHPESE